MREPLGKLQPAALFGIHGNGLGHFGGGEEPARNGITELIGFAVAIDFGVANLLCFAHAHGEILRRGRRRTLRREHLAAALGAAGVGVQSDRLTGGERAREEGELRHVAGEGLREKIVAAADEDGLRAAGGDGHFAFKLRLGIAVEIQPRVLAVPHEHEMIPCARRDDRATG